MHPINNNNELNNNHAFVVGMSGSGKTSFVKKKWLKPTDQVAIYDPKREYEGMLVGRQVRSYVKLKDFASALLAGRKTTQGFKIAYRPDEPSVTDFDNYCRVVWAAGNGRHKKPLKTINEEVAEYGSSGAGKAKGYFGKLLRLSRAYGIQTINVFQRGQEVSKTIIDNCEYACIMKQKTPKSAKYLDELTGIPASEIALLQKFDYILQQGSDYTVGKVKW
ncbi:MAG: DNA helicase HerA-like ATPase [Moritella dasanensis]|jgi:DNA helicase HerA-like ATPase